VLIMTVVLGVVEVGRLLATVLVRCTNEEGSCMAGRLLSRSPESIP